MGLVLMALDLVQRTSGSQPFVKSVPEVHADHLQNVHGWIWCWEFPRGIHWPVCSCGWLPDDGFTDRDAALDSRCERDRR